MKHFLLLKLTPFLLFAFFPICRSGVPQSRYEAMMKQESISSGLYDASDKVYILTDANFKDSVVEQKHASLVEFYNSYCGHCKRFAPVYKELAAKVFHWRNVIKVMAIDCAAEENNGICREYEVMGYPTLKYFSPNYLPSENNYGSNINTQDPDTILEIISKNSVDETAVGGTWPNFANLTEEESTDLFSELPKEVQFVVLVLEPQNSSLGAQTILNLNRYPQLHVRRVTDEKLASHYQLGLTHRLGVIDRNRNVELIQYSNETADEFQKVLNTFVRMNNIKETTDKSTQSVGEKNTLLNEELQEEARKNKEILKEVQRSKHLVYQADLEQAIRHILFNEIPKVNDISGERLLALQRLINVLRRYNPLGPNGIVFINKLQEYVALNNQAIDGKDFEDRIHRLESELSPIFSSSRYIGCTGSKSNYRGFTCSLWKLFHFWTVQADVSDKSTDPLEVLQALHGFVKYFFGCTECAEHFQEMAKRRKIWNTPTKDEAVLWLWEAHNEVNARLAGDETEDPQFPKLQFPTKESCHLCQKNVTSSSITWDRVAVLSFLKNINNPAYVSRFGLDNPDILHENIEKLRQKRMIGNVFSDMDMRMGMLLYGFCIVMMIVAFKLFAYKGYRKKPYAHDFLGKV